MGKIPRIFALGLLVCIAALGLELASGRAVAATSGDNADELEELLDSNGDETQVETEQDYALPVPKSAEENAPRLNEADQGPINPGERSSEDLFLPVPSDQVGLPAVEGEASEDYMPFFRAGDVRHDVNESVYGKPGFTLFGGMSSKVYPAVNDAVGNALIPGSKYGLEVGLNLRIFGWSLFKMPMSLQALGAVTFNSLNDVTGSEYIASAGQNEVVTAGSVKERIYRVGPILEWQLSRRFQLLGGVFKYLNEFDTSGGNYTTNVAGVLTQNSVDANLVLSPFRQNTFTFGAGLEWDFYVIPHADFGLRGWVEPNYFSVCLTFSAEPAPKHRNSLNFEWE